MIESLEHREYLINIAEKLRHAKQSIATDSNGNPTEEYLEYISLMYSPNVAMIAQFLKPVPRLTFSFKLSRLTGISRKEVKEILEKPTQQMYIVKIGGLYALPPPVFIHDGPFILNSSYKGRNGQKFALLGKKIFEDGYYRTWQTDVDGTPISQVLKVDKEVEKTSTILPSDEILKLIEKTKYFAKIPCACRNREEKLGNRKCKHKYPIHTCLLLGVFAKRFISLNDPIIEAISKEEAIENIKKSAEMGLVLTSENVKNSKIICSCCDCCCTFMRGILELDNPNAMAKADYRCIIDYELCNNCGLCEDWCKFKAIIIDEKPLIDEKKCMGCGICAVPCPKNAISMIKI